MALPEDVSTFSLTFGPYLDARGDVVLKGQQGKLIPVDANGRPVRVVHAETGAAILPLEIPIVLGDNGSAMIDGLAHTDEPSLFPQPFLYRVIWSESVRIFSGRAVTPENKIIAAPIASGDALIFDQLIPSVGEPAVSIQAQGVPPGGLTGEVLTKLSNNDFETDWVGLDNYTTDDELADALESYVTNGVLTSTLSGYTTDAELAAALDAIPEPDLSPYATITQVEAIPVPDLSPYATVAQVNAIPVPDLSPYATIVQLGGYVSDEELASALEALNTSFISTDERAKLAGIATGATANATDAQLRDRTTHTGVQTTATITDLREYIEDTVGGMLRAVGADLDISYDDQAGTLTIDYTGVTNDPEAIRDTIGAAMVGLGNISVLVNDAADTITITTSATVNATDAALRDRSTHTGTQLAATISDLATVISDAIGATGTNLSTANTLVRRDASGVAAFNNVDVAFAPTSAWHATRKDYVDGIGTPSVVANSVVRRDADGGASFSAAYASGNPTDPSMLARKAYVDAFGAATPVSTWTNTGVTSVTPLATWAPGVQVWTLASNLTIGTFPTTATGRSATVTLVLVQAAAGTGPFTVTWPSGIKWANGAAAPVMPTTASARLVVHMFWDGVNTWYGMVGGTFF